MDSITTLPKTHYAVRGAAAFGVTALLVFALSAWYTAGTGREQALYFVAAGPICGIAAGFAYGRKFVLPLVFALSFVGVGAMFMYPDPRSTQLVNVVLMGYGCAFLFWSIGGCATLALPVEYRFNGAKSFGIAGGLAGMAFQFLYGPVYALLELDHVGWWDKYSWETLVLWLTAGVVGGWLFGSELDKKNREVKSPADNADNVVSTGIRNSWSIASVITAAIGLGTGAFYFLRSALPLGLINGLNPSALAADWFWSWGLLAAAIGFIASIQLIMNKRTQRGWSWAILGIVLSVSLLFTSSKIAATPWKTQFNQSYAAKLLQQHGAENDPDYPLAIYKGNLILAQAALDKDDIGSAKQYLLAAATTIGFHDIEESGPDTSVARVLMQRGERDTVMAYLQKFHALWPKGEPVLLRWENSIRSGRQPNFNSRSPNAQGGGGRQQEQQQYP